MLAIVESPAWRHCQWSELRSGVRAWTKGAKTQSPGQGFEDDQCNGKEVVREFVPSACDSLSTDPSALSKQGQSTFP